jgi:predicted ATP-dependent protease
MPAVEPLSVAQLYSRCDESLLEFETSAELPGQTEVVGQQRAVDALELAVALRQPGYNAFVLGDAGSGRHKVVRRLLEARAASEAAADDWCYVNNFDETNKPRLLRLPAGRGAALARDMELFVAELARALPAAFESDAHQARIDAIQTAYKQREENALEELGQAAVAEGIGLMRTPQGFAFAPLKDGEAMAPQEFSKLPDAEKERIGKLIEGFSARLTQLMQQLPRWRREAQAQIKDASRENLGLAAGHLIGELHERYRDLPEVTAFLDQVMHDIVETGEPLREQGGREEGLAGLVLPTATPHLRYRVNLLVAGAAAAPMVYEDNPTFANLVGRIDQVAQFGTLVTNFMYIKPGALQRANGGYLMLDALKVLTQPFAWEALKRALSSAQVRIESAGQAWGLAGSVALEPQPMPLALKVVLIGERRVYYLLKDADPDFAELFKISADFDDDLVRDASSTRVYADFLATLARDAALRPLQRGAVARLLEHGARLSGDAQRLSANRRELADLLREADHCAALAGRELVLRDDVDAALRAQVRRVARVRDRLRDEILEGTLMVSVQGARVGQVNGLAVMALDDFLFAHPVRISATTHLGESGVIDIERESELGGALHSKGVMILSSFLGARFARSVPMALAASLVFEQSYGPVDGDSASMAELCALLSCLAGAPIRQSLAITGSVNQFGDAQAIGAVNEKIEGYFDICAARGLDGTQGVLIPAANVRHLMLRQDVVDACAAGRFHVWPVRDVDEAIELLTGVPAGRPDAKGWTAEGTLNHRVAAALAEMAARRRDFASGGGRRHGRSRNRRQADA